MQAQPSQPAFGSAPCGCGDGHSHGNPSGLSCNWCGKPLPAGVTIRREFCDSKCRQRFYTAEKQAARAEARKSQKCLFCGGQMGAYGRIYCSEACKVRSGDDMRAKRNKRNCKVCGKRFFPTNEGQVYCGLKCRDDDKRIRWPKVCLVCGITFRPHQVEQVTCSRACKGQMQRTVPDRTCIGCGQVFRPKRAAQTACSKSCAMKARMRKG
ncbi:hypothetical protein RSP03_01920 [Cereibacter sphaeroides]|nr:hypothetical protein RSP03_01920 [Cereibacter sphaeroides]